MGHKLLEGKTGIIFGALDELSIAWKVAERAKEEGANLILTNYALALRMGKIKELGEKTDSEVVVADATSVEDINALLDVAEKKFGKIDFVLHSIGMSPNVRKKREYTNLNYDWLNKTYDISAMSFHKILQALYQRDMMNEWGSVVGLSYMAAQRTFSGYNDMAEAKAILESIARSFGYYYGKKANVRVNTISQSPTPTTAGQGVSGFNRMLNYGDKMSPLGNATAEECADYCIMMFSDYTKKVTMQNLFHDGGFSMVGISDEISASLEDE